MLFSFNVPCQITPLLNLRSLTFGLMPCSIMLTPYSDRHIIFYLHSLFQECSNYGTKEGLVYENNCTVNINIKRKRNFI